MAVLSAVTCPTCGVPVPLFRATTEFVCPYCASSLRLVAGYERPTNQLDALCPPSRSVGRAATPTADDIYYAACQSDAGAIDEAVRLGADINGHVSLRSSCTPLIALLLTTDAPQDQIATLLQRGAHVNCQIPDPVYGGVSALGVCTLRNLTAAFRLLLDGRADVNYGRSSPLFLAILTGNREAVSALLGLGAGVDTQGEYNGDRFDCVHAALEARDLETLGLLLRRGASLTGARDGFFPLHLAARLGYWRAVELLCDMGADVNEMTPGGIDGYERSTALYIAGHAEDGRVMKSLLKKGALTARHGAERDVKERIEGKYGEYRTVVESSSICGLLDRLLNELRSKDESLVLNRDAHRIRIGKIERWQAAVARTLWPEHIASVSMFLAIPAVGILLFQAEERYLAHGASHEWSWGDYIMGELLFFAPRAGVRNPFGFLLENFLGFMLGLIPIVLIILWAGWAWAHLAGASLVSRTNWADLPD